MNEEILEKCKGLVGKTYITQATDIKRIFTTQISQLISQRKWPEKGWSEQWIELFLNQVSAMDNNNFTKKSQVGEREGRILSSLVARRHYNFGHGIGRSGYLIEVQPKAAGSSLIVKITNDVTKDALKHFGLKSITSAIILPTATGMTLTLCLLTLKKLRPQGRVVLFLRIDQKSCIKSVLAAGLDLFVIDTKLNTVNNDELITDFDQLKKSIEEIGPKNILCVMSTTSCFAPRSPDDIISVAELCRVQTIPHLINNAYGLQASKFCHIIEQGSKKGRIDFVVQSTDKNFLVPVGGAIVASYEQGLVEGLCKLYPGRASITNHLDVLITLLQTGRAHFDKLLKERKEMFVYLNNQMVKCASKFNERVLLSPGNKISIGMTLNNFKDVTYIGSMLFKRLVSGTRIIQKGLTSVIEGIEFKGFGSSNSHYHSHYLTAAASVGVAKADIDLFIQRLSEVLNEIKKSETGNMKTLSNNEPEIQFEEEKKNDENEKKSHVEGEKIQ